MHVYILYSEALGRYYVGHTQDVFGRLLEHNSGEDFLTSAGAPWELIATFPCSSRPEAVGLEMVIKNRGILCYLQDCGMLAVT
jgi:putative endonuclease